MKKTFSHIVFILLFLFVCSFIFQVGQVVAASNDRVFTAQELSEFNGKDGKKSYTSYKGLVYDVSDSVLWKLGEHFGLNAGVDLTDRMDEAPHGEEVFTGFEVIGTFEGYVSSDTAGKPGEETTDVKDSKVAVTNKSEVSEEIAVVPKKVWYEKRIKIAGFSILGWSGIVLGILFVLTFASCFALPWAKLPLPWKGSKIGSDPLDVAKQHMTWSSVHKHFVWVTVVIGIIHGIIGFLQMLGIYL